MGIAVVAPASAAADARQLNLKVLLIGPTTPGSTTAAWQDALNREGVPYTLVPATPTNYGETITLPALSNGNTGYYNGVVIADAPNMYQTSLQPLFSYESTFAVRQITGYVYPNSGWCLQTATSSVRTATLPLDVIVGYPPTYLSASTASFTVGRYATFSPLADQYPGGQLVESGTLPPGLFVDSSTGEISGTPDPGSAGSYPITFTASNYYGTAQQAVTITVS